MGRKKLKKLSFSFLSYVCSVLVVCVYRLTVSLLYSIQLCYEASDPVLPALRIGNCTVHSATLRFTTHITNIPATVGDWLGNEFRVAIHGNLMLR